MSKVKSILKKCEIETAKGKRTCRNTGRRICVGETCLVVFDSQQDRYNYSAEVALKMIEAARKRLDELEAMFGETCIIETKAVKENGGRRVKNAKVLAETHSGEIGVIKKSWNGSRN